MPQMQLAHYISAFITYAAPFSEKDKAPIRNVGI
jgi:hypothetical protein